MRRNSERGVETLTVERLGPTAGLVLNPSRTPDTWQALDNPRVRDGPRRGWIKNGWTTALDVGRNYGLRVTLLGAVNRKRT